VECAPFLSRMAVKRTERGCRPLKATAAGQRGAPGVQGNAAEVAATRAFGRVVVPVALAAEQRLRYLTLDTGANTLILRCSGQWPFCWTRHLGRMRMAYCRRACSRRCTWMESATWCVWQGSGRDCLPPASSGPSKRMKILRFERRAAAPVLHYLVPQCLNRFRNCRRLPSR